MSEKEEHDRGTLKPGEPHPAVEYAREYLFGKDLVGWIEPLASCAIEGNRLAEICLETLQRLLKKEPVSDRYLMGLAWMIWKMEQGEIKEGRKNIKRWRKKERP